MKMEQVSFLEWQTRYGREAACIDALRMIRWPEGFQCPKCGHHEASLISTRRLHQCSQCFHQVSATAGTLFHSTKLPLVKWFLVIYLLGADKGGLSALRLAKFGGCFLVDGAQEASETPGGHGRSGPCLQTD